MEDTIRSQKQHDSRKRSRSPEHCKLPSQDVKRHHGHRRNERDRSPKALLPFQSPQLHKRDLDSYRALFAEYLDLKKGLDVTRLGEDEVKGRWKSFVGKWNRGDLSEGWYDPSLKERVDGRNGYVRRTERPQKSVVRHVKDGHVVNKAGASSEDDEDFGPSLPEFDRGKKSGPAIPTFPDLQYQREQAKEDRESQISDLRYERKQDRQAQKERLEELVPRAQAGTRERQLEKRRDVAASNKSFAESKEAGAEDVGEGDLMGDDGIENYKARLKAAEKQRNEREVRKEEVLRARAAEREERLAVQRAKEEKTMEMLKGIARQRFGGAS